MNTSDEPIVVSESISGQQLMQKLLADNPEIPPDAPKAEAAAPKEEVKTEVKEESKSAKAAKESKALRAAKQREAELMTQLQAAQGLKTEAETFAKVKELFKKNPKEAIKAFGANPLDAYRELTDNFLAQDIDMQAKDPTKEKLSEVDTYIEALKKREADLATQQLKIDELTMINENVNPVLLKAEEEYECLLQYCNNDKKVLARQIYNAANDYYTKQLKSNSEQLWKEHTNFQTFFKTTADHLEKQLSNQIEQNIENAAKLKKFEKKFQAQKAAENLSKSEESNSSFDNTLDRVISNSSKVPDKHIIVNFDKREAIKKLLRENPE